jgi:hypothetical protein
VDASATVAVRRLWGDACVIAGGGVAAVVMIGAELAAKGLRARRGPPGTRSAREIPGGPSHALVGATPASRPPTNFRS